MLNDKFGLFLMIIFNYVSVNVLRILSGIISNIEIGID